jgi:hypothetical protein
MCRLLLACSLDDVSGGHFHAFFSAIAAHFQDPWPRMRPTLPLRNDQETPMKDMSTLPIAFVVLSAAAQGTSPDEMTIEQLQRVWLQCDRLASTSLVQSGSAAACSQVHEQLLRRGFGGDFTRMLTWWQTQRLREPTASTADIAAAERPGPSALSIDRPKAAGQPAV